VPPTVTHTFKEGDSTEQHIYMKQAHNGQIIAGGDRIVTDVTAVPNAAIDDQMNNRLKAFAE